MYEVTVKPLSTVLEFQVDMPTIKFWRRHFFADLMDLFSRPFICRSQQNVFCRSKRLNIRQQSCAKYFKKN